MSAIFDSKSWPISKGAGHHTWEFITAENQDLFTDIVAYGLREDFESLKIIYSKAINCY